MIQETATEREFVRSPEQMQELLEQLDRRGFKLGRLEQKGQTAKDEEELVQHLRELAPSVNGDMDHLVEDLQLYRQEIVAKKEWTVWEFLKSIPHRVVETISAHPAITISIIVGGLLAGAYYSGLAAPVIGRIRDWLVLQMGGAEVAEAVGAAKEAVGAAKEVTAEAVGAATANAAEATEAAKGVLEGVGKAAQEAAPSVIPPAPLPTTLPTVDEAEEILRAFERGT